jgi:serine/threonine protein kinase
MATAPDSPLSPGSTLLERYRILGIMGMGRVGAVYQARDLNFYNVVKLYAIKEMINLTQDQQIRDLMMGQFTREAELLAIVNHPAIPKIYDFFSLGDRAYLVMEFINGRDLEAILNCTDKLIPAEQVREWGIAICQVLAYLHNLELVPIIFRNIQPSNVMIDSRRAVRLVGFSIAKTFRPGQPGTKLGAEGYSPPELLQKGEASPAGDVYSIGATLHHLLTRQDPRSEPPFSFDQRPIQQFNPEVSDEFVAVIERALALDPSERFATAAEMGQALKALQG